MNELFRNRSGGTHNGYLTYAGWRDDICPKPYHFKDLGQFNPDSDLPFTLDKSRLDHPSWLYKVIKWVGDPFHIWMSQITLRDLYELSEGGERPRRRVRTYSITYVSKTEKIAFDLKPKWYYQGIGWRKGKTWYFGVWHSCSYYRDCYKQLQWKIN